MSERGKPLFEIGPYKGWPTTDGRFFYDEVGGNGEILNSSQPYETKEHAEEGAQAALDRAVEFAYDSRPDTHEHIGQVRGLVLGVAADLTRRSHIHDRSKLVDPEREVFDRVTPELAGLTYGSDEYKASLASMGVALDHHYAANDHHPEHHDPEGIAAMDLVQLTEMLCDWIAATRRHDDGDIHKSINQSAERFGYGEELRDLLHRSVDGILASELA